MVQPLWKTVQRFLKKKNVIQQYDPAILLWGMYSKEFKVVSLYILRCSQHYSQQPGGESSTNAD